MWIFHSLLQVHHEHLSTEGTLRGSSNASSADAFSAWAPFDCHVARCAAVTPRRLCAEATSSTASVAFLLQGSVLRREFVEVLRFALQSWLFEGFLSGQFSVVNASEIRARIDDRGSCRRWSQRAFTWQILPHDSAVLPGLRYFLDRNVQKSGCLSCVETFIKRGKMPDGSRDKHF